MRQVTYGDDNIITYDAINGDDQQRRNARILKNKAKRAGVQLQQPQQQEGGMPGM